MGKYTGLVRRLEEPKPQERGVANSANVNINNIYNNIEEGVDKPTSGRPEPTLQGPPPVEMSQDVASGGKVEAEGRAKSATPLRPYAVYAVVRCIHSKPSDACAVCNGYARWLRAGGGGRIEKSRRNPEAVRREFWQGVLGEGA